MDNFERIINPVSDFIKRYRCLKCIKIKFTFGKYTDFFGFDNDIFNKEHYYKIENIFNNSDKIETINNLKFKNSKSNIIDKIVLLCKNGPYDILITAEIEENNLIYSLQNLINSGNSYIYKNHSFNLIFSTNDINEKKYTFFIESYIPKNYTDIYIAHSSLLKVKDILSICSPSEGDLTFTILQKNK